MIAEERLYKYAKLLVGTGCALKKGQPVLISAPVEIAPFVRLAAKAAWELGAGDVTVQWSDPEVDRLRYVNGDAGLFDATPAWEVTLLETAAEKGAAVLRLGGGMFGMEGVDPKRMTAKMRAGRRDCPKFNAGLGKGSTTRCGAGVPTAAWAKKVFPDLPEAEAIDQLWEAILKVARADGPDPAQAWADHAASFQRRIKLLTDRQFDAVRYTAANGTDLTVGLLPGHRWHGGGIDNEDGVYYFPNVPTEEIFTSPDRRRTRGVVHSSLPLSYQGEMIRDFWLKFEEGKVVDFGAAAGEEKLRSIIEADDSSCYLGEAALVPQSSPISQLGLLFYSTLYDENAACHLALGRCYPFCLEGGNQMSEEELKAHHLNISAVHCDFMIGTADMAVTGILPDGTEVPIFKDGDWTGEFV